MKELIPANEQSDTNAMFTKRQSKTLHRGSFVRVRCKGRAYRGVLGLVKRLDAEALQVHVVVEA